MNRRFGVPALAGPYRLKAGHRTGDPHPGRFMVPMHAQKRKEALREPSHSSSSSTSRSLPAFSSTRRTTRTIRFLVPMPGYDPNNTHTYFFTDRPAPKDY